MLLPPSSARSSAGKRPTSAPAFRGDRLLRYRLDRPRAGRLPHRGYTPFTIDVTPFLSGGAACEIIVRAEDDPADLTKPRGKQDWQLEPHSIWYPRTTGIWQTVWSRTCPVDMDCHGSMGLEPGAMGHWPRGPYRRRVARRPSPWRQAASPRAADRRRHLRVVVTRNRATNRALRPWHR